MTETVRLCLSLSLHQSDSMIPFSFQVVRWLLFVISSRWTHDVFTERRPHRDRHRRRPRNGFGHAQEGEGPHLELGSGGPDGQPWIKEVKLQEMGAKDVLGRLGSTCLDLSLTTLYKILMWVICHLLESGGVEVNVQVGNVDIVVKN